MPVIKPELETSAEFEDGSRKLRAMISEAQRLRALNEIRQNIAEHGCHIYVVTGGGYPHFGYTVGLSESLGAELILAGTYFYRLDEVSKVIKGVVGELRPTVELETLRIESDSWGTFSLRRVHMSWAKSLMLGAFDFYKVETIRAYQIVPDEAHWTIEVPDLTQSWSSAKAPAWRWLHEEWTYPVPKDSVALTDLDALRGKRITEVMRWEEDEWEIFAGAGPDVPETERRVVPLGVLLASDESLLPAVNLTVGTGFWRNADSGWVPWMESEEDGDMSI